MFKAFINLVALSFLVVLNLTLFIWCINQFEFGPSPKKKMLIKEVQAQVNVYVPRTAQRIKSITQRPILNNSTHVIHNLEQDKPSQKVVLQFKPKHFHLDKTEQSKLENKLQHLDIRTFHLVKIFAGTTLSEKKSRFPKLAKLRLQSIARIIYPYTQTVKMYYRSSIDIGEDKIVVKFSESYKN